MLAGPGERGGPAIGADPSFGFIAWSDDVPVGFIDVQVLRFARARRRGYIVMGVLQAHTRQGHGRALLERAIAEAQRRDLRRLELTVQRRNVAAVALYRSCGLTIEGVRRAAVQINGVDIDEYYMARLLNDSTEGPDSPPWNSAQLARTTAAVWSWSPDSG